MRTLYSAIQICTIICALSLPVDAQSHNAQRSPPPSYPAEALVEQMRGMSMQMQATYNAPTPDSFQRGILYKHFRLLGTNAILPLASALSDPDVQMRKNSALVLFNINVPWLDESRVDTILALPALISAMNDTDVTVRGWSAQAIGNMGPAGSPAVPYLIRFLSSPEEGLRNSGAIALRGIGAPAISALPALRISLYDPKDDPRKFAQMAITAIEEAILNKVMKTNGTQQGAADYRRQSPPQSER